MNDFGDFGGFNISSLTSLQKILIEYIMLDGVNDEEQHAHQLGKLLETFQVVSTQYLLKSTREISEF